MYLGVTIRLPYDATSRGIVGDVVTRTLRQLGDDADSVEGMHQAMSDACANVAHQSSGKDDYEVQVCIDERSCSILLHDLGPAGRRR